MFVFFLLLFSLIMVLQVFGSISHMNPCLQEVMSAAGASVSVDGFDLLCDFSCFITGHSSG